MSSAGARKIKHRNKAALSVISSNHRNSLNFSDCNKEGSVQKDSQTSHPFLFKSNAQSILTDLKSQSDIFTPCYRPSTRHVKKNSLRHRCFETSCPSTERSVFTKPNDQNFNKRTCVAKSGRMSQLAGRVEQLIIQDPSNSSNPIVTSASLPNYLNKNELPLHHSHKSDSCNFKKSSHENCAILTDFKQKATNQLMSPWYRYCRPRAPVPPLTSTTTSTDVLPLHSTNEATESRHTVHPYTVVGGHNTISSSVTSSSSSSSISSDNFCTTHIDEPIISANNVIINQNHKSILDDNDDYLYPVQFQSPDLETDLSQENINWHSDYILNPGPIDDFTIEDITYRNSSPIFENSLSYPQPRTQSSFANCCSDEVILSPLTSITNILSSHITLSRCPKWSIGRSSEHNRHLSYNRSHRYHHYSNSNQQQFVNTDTDVNSPPTIPSPPPLIMEPRIHSDITNRPFERPACVINPILARPTVLKREAPDGAEHNGAEEIGENKPSWKQYTLSSDQDLTTKRNIEPDSPCLSNDYSPKKIRMNLLLPSEHSAFLPVNGGTTTTNLKSLQQ